MGFDFNDFNGGPYEGGKDIIAHKESEYGDTEITAIQSKMLKTYKSSISSTYFSQIIYQLRQCIGKKIACHDGISRSPIKVILITPFDIDTRHLEDQLETISLERVIIVDRGRLQKALDKYWCDVYDDFEDVGSSVVRFKPNETKNLELHKALNIVSGQDYSDYYSDLNFFVGKTESQKVFSSELKIIQPNKLQLNEDQWIKLKKLNEYISQHINSGLITTGIHEIETEFHEKLCIFKGKLNQEKIHHLKLLDKQLSEEHSSLKTMLKEIFTRLDEIDSTHESNSEAKEYSIELRQKLKDVSSIDSNKEKTLLLQNLNQSEDNRTPKELQKDISDLISLTQDITTKKDDKKRTEHSIKPMPTYEVALDIKGVESDFRQKVDDIKERLCLLNKNKLNIVEIKSLLEQVNSVLRYIDYLTNQLENSYLKFALVKSTEHDGTLNISAHKLFDSGCNIAVYGDAGAGKSTTLHVYADKLNKNQSKHEETIFLPLNRIVRNIIKQPLEEYKALIEDQDPVDALINAFFLYKKIPYSTENILEFWKYLESKNKVIFIIDALDEAASEAHWVTSAIGCLPQKITNIQVITSSRSTVRDIKNIDFLGITLLPFTKEQLKRFIFGWIKNPDDKLLLWDQIVEKEIFEVAKNPLLATIVCTLYESGVSIPNSEPEIYRKKIELLSGHYDHYKGIQRTKQPKNMLEKCCRKIAFAMHIKELREASIDELKSYLLYALEEKVSKALIDEVLDDLINSCNILLPTDEENTYSFGHLRIQEFLASEELSANRSVDIVPLVRNDWWAGVLYLYGCSQDIQQIIDDIYTRSNNFIRYMPGIESMLKSQPKPIQKELRKMMVDHEKFDLLAGYDEHGFYDEV
jgi:hypothetical protein